MYKKESSVLKSKKNVSLLILLKQLPREVFIYILHYVSNLTTFDWAIDYGNETNKDNSQKNKNNEVSQNTEKDYKILKFNKTFPSSCNSLFFQHAYFLVYNKILLTKLCNSGYFKYKEIYDSFTELLSSGVDEYNQKIKQYNLKQPTPKPFCEENEIIIHKLPKENYMQMQKELLTTLKKLIKILEKAKFLNSENFYYLLRSLFIISDIAPFQLDKKVPRDTQVINAIKRFCCQLEYLNTKESLTIGKFRKICTSKSPLELTSKIFNTLLIDKKSQEFCNYIISKNSNIVAYHAIQLLETFISLKISNVIVKQYNLYDTIQKDLKDGNLTKHSYLIEIIQTFGDKPLLLSSDIFKCIIDNLQNDDYLLHCNTVIKCIKEAKLLTPDIVNLIFKPKDEDLILYYYTVVETLFKEFEKGFKELMIDVVNMIKWKSAEEKTKPWDTSFQQSYYVGILITFALANMLDNNILKVWRKLDKAYGMNVFVAVETLKEVELLTHDMFKLLCKYPGQAEGMANIFAALKKAHLLSPNNKKFIITNIEQAPNWEIIFTEISQIDDSKKTIIMKTVLDCIRTKFEPTNITEKVATTIADTVFLLNKVEILTEKNILAFFETKQYEDMYWILNIMETNNWLSPEKNTFSMAINFVKSSSIPHLRKLIDSGKFSDAVFDFLSAKPKRLDKMYDFAEIIKGLAPIGVKELVTVENLEKLEKFTNISAVLVSIFKSLDKCCYLNQTILESLLTKNTQELKQLETNLLSCGEINKYAKYRGNLNKIECLVNVSNKRKKRVKRKVEEYKKKSAKKVEKMLGLNLISPKETNNSSFFAGKQFTKDKKENKLDEKPSETLNEQQEHDEIPAVVNTVKPKFFENTNQQSQWETIYNPENGDNHFYNSIKAYKTVQEVKEFCKESCGIM